MKQKNETVSNNETNETMNSFKVENFLGTGQVYGENSQYVKATIDDFDYNTKNSTMMGHIYDEDGVMVSEVYKCNNAPVVFGVMEFCGDKEILKITNIKFPESCKYVSLDGENGPKDSTMIGQIYLDNGYLF